MRPPRRYFRSRILTLLSGSRDPYDIRSYGAGFALCWKGSPQLLVGQPNSAGELIQVISGSMLVIIPKYVHEVLTRVKHAYPSVVLRTPMVANHVRLRLKERRRAEPKPFAPNFALVCASASGSHWSGHVGQNVRAVLANRSIAAVGCSRSNRTTT